MYKTLLKDILQIVTLSVVFGIFLFFAINYDMFNTEKISGSIKVDSISCEDAYDLFMKSDEQNVVFIDARHREFYSMEHIKNALSIPLYRWAYYHSAVLDHLDKTTIVITYCDTYICGMGKSLAAAIKNKYRFKRIYFLKDGIDKWVTLGYPVAGRNYMVD